MKKSPFVLLTLLAISTALLAPACGGSDEGEEGDTPQQDADGAGGGEETETDGGTVSDPDGGIGGNGEPTTDSSGGEVSINVTVTQAAVPTVAVVQWSTDLDPMDSAVVEYGSDTEYGSEVEVDLSAKNHRTLVLGLKGSGKTYHLRVAVASGGETYHSDDQTFTTGDLPNELPELQVTWNDPLKDRLEKGFTLTTTLLSGSHAVIIDADGDYVWWYRLTDFKTGTGNLTGGGQMVFDWEGESIYILSANVSFEPIGAILRVSVDGESTTLYDAESLGRPFYAHHSMTAVPGGGVAFLEYDPDTACEVIRHLDEEGNITDLYAVNQDIEFPVVPPDLRCHANYLDYVQSADAFVISVLGFDTVLLVKRDKTLLWAMGADDYETVPSNPDWDFGGQDESFESQHGLQAWNQGKSLLLFNNGGGDVIGTKGQTAVIWEYTLDEGFTSAEGVEYYRKEGLNSGHFGNLMRLPGGNTMLNYSTAGTILQVTEVNPGNVQVVQQIKTGQTQMFGYAGWQPSLYGQLARL